jgi:hypothetical protein
MRLFFNKGGRKVIRTNRKMAILLVLAMLMTMFAGLGTASAALVTTTYSCVQPPPIAQDTLTASATSGQIGTILIDWDVLLPGPGTNAGLHQGIFTLPDGFEFNGTTGGFITVTKPGDETYALPAPRVPITLLSDKEAMVTIPNVTMTAYNKVQVALFLENVKVSSSAPAGPAVVKVSNVAGLFPTGEVTINTVTGGKAIVSITDTKTFRGGEDVEVTLTVTEDVPGGVSKKASTLKFKLPKGFEWIDNSTTEVSLAQSQNLSYGAMTLRTDDQGRVLIVDRSATDGNTARSIFKIKAKVKVDETVANFGDVNISISGKSSVTPSELLIGSYADYGYTIEVDDPEKEILAGRKGDDAEISSFTIKENIKESLIANRTVYMTLPDGVEWDLVTAGQLDIEAKNKAGNLNLVSISTVTNKPSMAKATIQNALGASKGQAKVEARVKVAVDYDGPITIKFSGSAGIADEITVGKVVKPLSGVAELKDVRIGVQNQPAGDITITEVQKEVLLSDGTRGLAVRAPSGVEWAKLPTVTVSEGDVTLGIITRADYGATRNNVLVIPIRAQSDVASSIKISDVYFNVDRTVPEGDMILQLLGNAVDDANIINRDVALEFVAAKVITPAPGETMGNGEFKIGSNIYYVGGVAKVMDVAPYIKGDRTYVPMRYLGEMLGAEVVWDDAARTVTLTRGETTVVFTIGSTSYTVNGEAKSADVAPEIASDRTMLPARFVAEAFGAIVGWDPGTQTVLIQN